MKKKLLISLMAFGLMVMFVSIAQDTIPTQPTLDETESELLGSDKPLIAFLLEAKSAPDKWRALGNTARAGFVIFLLMGALQVRIIRKYVWDPVPQRWRVLTLVIVSSVYGILNNISSGDVLWYNALLDGVVVGSEALLMKKILWNCLLGEGQTLKLDVLLSKLKLR